MSHLDDVILMTSYLELCTGKSELFVPFSGKSIDTSPPVVGVFAWFNVIKGESSNESGIVFEVSGLSISFMELNQIIVNSI